MDMHDQDQPEPIVPFKSASGEGPDQQESSQPTVGGTESATTDIHNQDTPDFTTIPDPETVEVVGEKINLAEIGASDDLPPVEIRKESQKVNRFLSVKSFLSGLLSKLEFTQKSKNYSQAPTTEIDPPEEMEDQEILVEKRLGALFNEEPEAENESQPAEELPAGANHPDLILTNLSRDIVPDQPPPQSPSLLPEGKKSPLEENFEPARLLSPFLPEDFDEPQSYEKDESTKEENSLVEEIKGNHDLQGSDLNEDPDLNERFRSFLGSEDEETTERFQQPFITDAENNPEVSEGKEEITLNGLSSFGAMQGTNATEVELPENWNNPFTTDPTTAMDEPPATSADIAVKENKGVTRRLTPDKQESLVQTTDLGINEEKNSLIIQDGLAQLENPPDENDDYLAIINQGLAQSGNPTAEEISPNPWEIVPDWSTLAEPEEKSTSQNLPGDNSEEPDQVEPVPAIPEKGFIASIPIFFKVLIVLLFVIDLAIIGVVGSSYVKIHLPIKPIATVVPTEIASYVYPDALKLTGGWIIQLNTGHLVNNKWTPVSAEWLIDTTFRRVVALPWSKQLEAVALTLKPGDPLELYMVNNDVISYQVEQVEKVPQSDTSFLKRNTPGLIIILYQTDSQERWIIICGQK